MVVKSGCVTLISNDNKVLACQKYLTPTCRNHIIDGWRAEFGVRFLKAQISIRPDEVENYLPIENLVNSVFVRKW